MTETVMCNIQIFCKLKTMSMKHNFYFLIIAALLSSFGGYAQPTAELSTTNFIGGQGPSTVAVGPISLMKDNSNTNTLTNLGGSDVTDVKFTLNNQQYAGLTYSNISTGLVFGAQPTTATGSPAVQAVDPLDIYNNLGYFLTSPGGPTDNMFTVSPSYPAGTGIVANPQFVPSPPDVNGAVSVFTAAQVQFDRPGGPSAYNSATRYYYGDLVIEFNRYIRNPVIHIAGLGGSYRYFPTSGTNINDPSQWLSTHFTTELEVQGFNVSRLSGNSFFQVSGSSILNNAAAPSGASVSTTGGLFDEIGAASGSVRVAATVKTIVLKVYLRGSDTGFPWSTLQANVAGSNRNPFTGDIWWVSVSSQLSELITLASTGVTLTGALNGNDVSLNWKTLTEINTRSFEIERSTDGINYMKVGEKAAAGNSVSDVNYNHIDPNMNVPVYYYRLKMNDIDGRYSYSNVVIVRKSSIKGIKTFPNPATDHVNIEFSNAKGSYNVALVNQLGQQVYSKKVDINNTVQYVRIERGTIPAGMYHVSIRDNNTGDVQSEKVLIK